MLTITRSENGKTGVTINRRGPWVSVRHRMGILPWMTFQDARDMMNLIALAIAEAEAEAADRGAPAHA